MKTIAFSAIEKEMANFNFDQLNSRNAQAKANIANAASVTDVTSEICSVWASVRKYVILAENIPVVGKFITIIADLLDSLCPTSQT
jgi:hypothetical protein